jgi:hypothetical protein
MACQNITVETIDNEPVYPLGQFLFKILRPDAHVNKLGTFARRAFRQRRARKPAIMTKLPSPARVQRRAHGTIGTFQSLAAVTAQNKLGKPAAVENDHALLAARVCIGNQIHHTLSHDRSGK